MPYEVQGLDLYLSSWWLEQNVEDDRGRTEGQDHGQEHANGMHAT